MDFQAFNILYYPNTFRVKIPAMTDLPVIKYLLTGLLALSVPGRRDARPVRWEAAAGYAFTTCLPGLVFQDSLQQGIGGTVYRVGGNQMPDPRHPPGPPAGVRATLYIFERTNISQVIRQGSSPYYYTSVGTRLVKQATTDDKGHFRVWLPPGTYSLFTKKGALFYASRRDEKNNIAPVEVLPGKITPVECRVESDHKAVY